MKIDTPLIILIITIAAAIAAYWANIKNNNQLDRIEEYDTLNNKLAEEIKELSELNGAISYRVDKIVLANNTLMGENIVLSNQTNELIDEVKKLTSSSNNLIKKVDLRTEISSFENALTGEINFDHNEPLKDNESLWIKSRGLKIGNTVSEYKSDSPPQHIVIGGIDIIPIKIIDGKLKISVTVYDLSGNQIVEIIDNVWRRNPNNSGKFNYDSKGFEIIDNKGLTALSINLDTRTNVSIEGYFLERKTNRINVFGKRYSTFLNNNLSKSIEVIEKSNIRRLFEYSGQNWLGKRKL